MHEMQGFYTRLTHATQFKENCLQHMQHKVQNVAVCHILSQHRYRHTDTTDSSMFSLALILLMSDVRISLTQWPQSLQMYITSR